MKTVTELLDEIKKKHSISSDYKLALFLNLREQSIGNYRHERTLPDAAACAKIAAALDLDADLLTVQIEAQRAKTEDARKLWERVALRLQTGFADVEILGLIAIILLATFSAPVQAAIVSVLSDAGASVYYVKLSAGVRLAWRLTRLAVNVNLCKAGSNVSCNPHAPAFLPA